MTRLLKLPGSHRDELPALALIEIGRQLTRSLDVDHVIAAIVEQTVAAISAADAAALFLHDTGSDRLIARAATGFDPDPLAKLRLRPNESLTGRVFAERRSAIFASAENVDEGMSTMSSENRHWYTFAIRHLPHPRSVMATPVQSVDRCWGVLVVDNFAAPRNFTAPDLALLEALASQATVALENADLYQRQKEHSQRLAELNRYLLRFRKAHDHMMRSILEGRDIQAMAGWLAQAVERPILVQDLFLNLMACSGDLEASGLPGRLEDYQLADTADMRPVLERLVATKRALDIPRSSRSDGPARRLAMPVSAGRDVLGYLVALNSEGLEPIDLMTLESAAMVFAVAMLQERAVVEIEQRLTGELLWSLISTDPDDRARHRAAQMGIDLKQLYSVMLIVMDQSDARSEQPEEQWHRHRRQVHSTTERFLRNRAEGSLVTMDSDKLIALVPKDPDSAPIRLASELQATLARDLPDFTFSIALGRETDDPSRYRTSYGEALRALRLNRTRRGRQQVIPYEALGPVRLILESTDRVQLARQAHDTLGPVLDYDRKHRTGLVKTLVAYVKENQKPAPTAKRLFIHVNTLNYRLGRIEDLLGGPLDDWDRRLDVQLALKILELPD